MPAVDSNPVWRETGGSRRYAPIQKPMNTEILTTSKGIGSAKGIVRFCDEENTSLNFEVKSSLRVPLRIRLSLASECEFGQCSLPSRENLGQQSKIKVTLKDSKGGELIGDPEDKAYNELKGAIIESACNALPWQMKTSNSFDGLSIPTFVSKSTS